MIRLLIALIFLFQSTAFAENFADGRSPARWNTSLQATLSTTTQRIKNQAGTLGGYYIYNPNSSAAYVHLYDTASTVGVTPGTVTPKLTFGIPATGGANMEYTNGTYFSNGIAVSTSTAATGNTANTSTITANFVYR